MFLELRHLRTLKAINDTGSLVQSAKRLHLTQSALSHQIKSVESHFDVKLYQRKHKPLRLTSAGKQLLNLAEKLLPQVEAAEFELKNLAETGSRRLHITIECHSCYEWLIPTLNEYRQRWPDVEVDIRFGNNFEPMPALITGDVDLVISSDQIVHNELHFEPLFDFEARALVAKNHSLSNKNCLSPQDFADQILITYPVDQARLDIFNKFLKPANIHPKEIRQTELTAMILQLIASHRGISVLPDWVLADYQVNDSIKTIPLGSKGMHGTVYAATRQREASLDYLQDFNSLARKSILNKRTKMKK